MAPVFRVRPGRPSDKDFLVRANLGIARETEDTELDRVILTRGVVRALEDEARGLYFIAEDEQRAVGSLLITWEWSDWRDGWIWWIQSVYVLPEQRRKGVYRCLHAGVLERARARSDIRLIRLYVDRENVGAQDTYVALGMHVGRYALMEQAL